MKSCSLKSILLKHSLEEVLSPLPHAYSWKRDCVQKVSYGKCNRRKYQRWCFTNFGAILYHHYKRNSFTNWCIAIDLNLYVCYLETKWNVNSNCYKLYVKHELYNFSNKCHKISIYSQKHWCHFRCVLFRNKCEFKVTCNTCIL